MEIWFDVYLVWFAWNTKSPLGFNNSYRVLSRIGSQLAHQTFFWLHNFFTFKILRVHVTREDAHLLFLLRHQQLFLHVFKHIVGHSLVGNRLVKSSFIDVATLVHFALSSILDGRLGSSAPSKPASLFEFIFDNLAQWLFPNIHWTYSSVVPLALRCITNTFIFVFIRFSQWIRWFAFVQVFVFRPHRLRCTIWTTGLLLGFGNRRTLKE